MIPSFVWIKIFVKFYWLHYRLIYVCIMDHLISVCNKINMDINLNDGM